MQKNIFKGVILSGMLWANIAAAQSVVVEVYNEGIEDRFIKKQRYDLHVSCGVESPDGSFKRSINLISALPPKGKAMLLKIENPFSDVEQEKLKSVRLSYAVQVVDVGDTLPLLSTRPLYISDSGIQDISRGLAENKITLRSLTEYAYDVLSNLDSEGADVKMAPLRREGAEYKYYFGAASF